MKLIIVDYSFFNSFIKDDFANKYILDNNISINIYKNLEDALLDLKSQNFIADYIFVDYNISILIGFGLISFVGQKTQFVLVGNNNNTNIKQAHSINNLSKIFNLHYVNKNLTISTIVTFLKSSRDVLDLDTYLIYCKKEYHLLKINQIIYIKSIGDYLNIVTKNRNYLVHSTIKKAQDQLSAVFFRPHRGYLINKKHVVKYSEKEILTSNDFSVPITKSRYKEVFYTLGTLE